jgi:uncharacterized protein YjbJ (UPF0337 family)
MNQDVLKGNWKQLRGDLKTWWGKLTDDDLDKIEGNWDKFIGTLQERYGWERERAEREAENRFRDYERSLNR